MAALIIAVAAFILFGIQSCPRADQETPAFTPGGWKP